MNHKKNINIIEKIKDFSEEISAFIGLIVIELNQYEHQFCIEDDYIDREIQDDFKKIIKKLRKIQKILINPFEYNDIQRSNIIYQEDSSCNILKFQKNMEDVKNINNHPTGYSFVVKSLCKKVSKKININQEEEVENDIKNVVTLFIDLELFFQTLGEYLNCNYFYKYI